MAFVVVLSCTVVLALLLVQLGNTARTFYAARHHGHLPPPLVRPLSLTDRILITLRFKKIALPVIPVVQTPAIFNKVGGKTFASDGTSPQAFSTADYENVKAILTSQSCDWGVQPIRLRAMKPLLGEGLLTTDGESWKRSRSVIQPSFAKSIVKELSKFEPYLDHLLSIIPQDGSTVDLQPLLFQMFADTSQKFILGSASGIFLADPTSTEDLPPTYVSAFQKSFMIMSSRMNASWFSLWKNTPEHKKTFKIIHDIIDKLVDKALTKINGSKGAIRSGAQGLRHTESMLEGVALLTNDRIEIRNQMIHGIMAGQDTLASVTGSIIFALSKNPSYWAQLHKQMLAIEDGPDLADELRGTSLLQNVIFESLRLYPIFPTLGRVALRDTFLPRGGGEDGNSKVFVPAGSRAFSHFYVLNRDATLFGETPDAFDPSRWDRVDGIHSRFMGFVMGPRGCLGRDKAINEASYVLWRLGRAFAKIESRDPGDWDGVQMLTCRNKNGCKVAFSR